ncbi:Mitochondrial chaperone BCS1 [Corchorus olitorius]|uniref:Mitochondrial chaperone BCS1 n=1 Tax=Corchorus olitorius TaxID=93759 RepID=A0A1R3IWJ8_9ROSI|nr:Mitochondrial chaperone BCS1 [Corchorus olitorius]
MPLKVASTRYSLVKGERIVRSVLTTRLPAWRASHFSYSPRRKGFVGFLKWWEEAASNIANFGNEGDPIEIWNQAVAEFIEFEEGTMSTNRPQELRTNQQAWRSSTSKGLHQA